MSYPEYKMGIIDDAGWAYECRDILPEDAYCDDEEEGEEDD